MYKAFVYYNLFFTLSYNYNKWFILFNNKLKIGKIVQVSNKIK